MEYAIGVVIGMFIGLSFAWFIIKKRFSNGTLKMTATEDKDVYTLFIDDMERILRRKYLLLKIERHTRK